MSELMDDDGENQAVRMFLLGYGAGGTVKAMREHLEMAGFDKHWPDWVEAQDGHLTKAGAQDWLRYLFGLEQNALKEQNALLTVQVQEGWKLVPVEPTADMKNAGIAYFREHKDDIFNSATHYQAMLAAAPALTKQVKSEDARDADFDLEAERIFTEELTGVVGRINPDATCIDDIFIFDAAPPDAAISAQD